MPLTNDERKFRFYPELYREEISQSKFGPIWHQLVFHSDLPPKAKMLAIVLASLTYNGDTSVTNKRLSEWLNLSDRQIRRMLRILEEKGVIFTDQTADRFRLISTPLKGGWSSNVRPDVPLDCISIISNSFLEDVFNLIQTINSLDDSVLIYITQFEESQMVPKRRKTESEMEIDPRTRKLTERLQAAMENNSQRPAPTLPIAQAVRTVQHAANKIKDREYFYAALNWYAEQMENETLKDHNLKMMIKFTALERPEILTRILDAYDQRERNAKVKWPKPSSGVRNKAKYCPDWDNMPRNIDKEEFLGVMQKSYDPFLECFPHPNSGSIIDLTSAWVNICIFHIVTRDRGKYPPKFYLFTWHHPFYFELMECVAPETRYIISDFLESRNIVPGPKGAKHD